MPDTNRLKRQLVSALLDEPARIATGRAYAVDPVSRTATVRMGGSASGVTLEIVAQDLANELANRVRAGDTPTVSIENGKVVGWPSTVGTVVRAGHSPALAPPQQPAGGSRLRAPLWGDPPLTGLVMGVIVRWQAIMSPSVIGYRVMVVEAGGTTTYETVSSDTTQVSLMGIAPGSVTVQVQAMGVGGVAGDWSSPQSSTVLADTEPPPPPTGLSLNWQSGAADTDLLIAWAHPTPLPSDWAGYDIEIRNASDSSLRRTVTLDGLPRSFRYTLAMNMADGAPAGLLAQPDLQVAIRSRDIYGNVSAWVTTTATFPALATPTVAPGLSTIFKQVNVSLPATPNFVDRTEVLVTPGNLTLQLAPGTTTANFFGQTGVTYTVDYRYVDVFGRFTTSSPSASIVVARNEIGFDDLGALEQIKATSSNPARTTAQCEALIDNKLFDQAFTTQAGELITFEFPIATRIAGILIYTPTAQTPQWVLRFENLAGTEFTLGSNFATQHSVIGTTNNMILRLLPAGNTTHYMEETTQSVGGYFLREYRFGDSNDTPSLRKPQAITTRRLSIHFFTATPIAEIRILTYEAANTFVGRRMYLNEGLQIESNATSTGFQITSAGLIGYNNGIEQARIDASDGRLKAAGGVVTLDSQGISIAPGLLPVNGLRLGAGWVGARREGTTLGVTTIEASYNGDGSGRGLISLRGAPATLGGAGAYVDIDGGVGITLATDIPGGGGSISLSTPALYLSTPFVQMSGFAGTLRDFHFASSGVGRWSLRIDNTAESGADQGSNFQIISRTDAGEFKAAILTINRATGYTRLTGRLGIARNPATYPLEVQGSAWKSDGSTTWLTSSDARTKRNVRAWSRGLAAIRALPDMQAWEYNGQGGTAAGQRAIGLMAEAVRTVIPEAVTETEQDIDGQRVLAIDYHPILMALIAAVKELATRMT